MSLDSINEVLKYSIIPILGAFALDRAAGIMVEELPRNTVLKKLMKEVELNSVITFEYGSVQNREESLQPGTK